MKKLAVLLTCYNRKEKTINCLKSLDSAIHKSSLDIHVEVYLVDDGSKDGTAEAVLQSYPDVNIISGTGNLFWAGGMRLAWKTALNASIDFYLLLNDDTFLFEDSIDRILKASIEYNTENLCDAIFIGSTIDKVTGKATYGGRKLYSQNNPKSYLVHNETKLVECDLGNANIMLVPNSIVQKIGILSEKYTHSIADHDYTLKAKKEGFKVFVMPGALGNCTNDGNRGLPAGSKLTKRIEYLYSQKGISYKEYLYFIRSQFPFHLPGAFLKLWLKTLFPGLYGKLKK